MKSCLFAVGAVVLCAALGCGSDDSDGEGGGGKGGTSSMSSAGSKASAGTSSGGSKSNGQAGSAGATTQAGSAGSSNNSGLSAACQKYCDCHDKNCASTPIPDDKSCGDFCTAFSEEQLACRQNMCKLVPDQPDNNHCIHSVGINECL